MDPKRLQKYVVRLLIGVLLVLGVIRIAAQIEPPASEAATPEVVQSEPNSAATMPEMAVGPGGETYVRADLQQAMMRGPDGIIAVVTNDSAYVWNNINSTWYSINLSGEPFQMILSQDTVGVLTTDRAYAWNLQANEWVWTFISGRPLDITGSNGHLGAITDREAYAFNRDTGAWTKTYLSGEVRDITGVDDYYGYTRYQPPQEQQ